MIKSIKKYTPYAIAIVFAFFYLRECSNRKQIVKEINDSWKYKEQMYLDNESTLIRDTTEKGEKIVTQKQLLVTKDQEKEMLLLENRSLKKIASEVKVRTITKIKKIDVSTTDTLIVYKGDTVRNAQKFFVNNKWYGINGTYFNKRVLFDSVYFNNEIVTTIGYKKDKGFKNTLKKPYPVVEVVNKNPYSSVNTVHNVIIKPRKKKWFETKAAVFGAGILGGAYLFSRTIR